MDTLRWSKVEDKWKKKQKVQGSKAQAQNKAPTTSEGHPLYEVQPQGTPEAAFTKHNTQKSPLRTTTNLQPLCQIYVAYLAICLLPTLFGIVLYNHD